MQNLYPIKKMVSPRMGVTFTTLFYHTCFLRFNLQLIEQNGNLGESHSKQLKRFCLQVNMWESGQYYLNCSSTVGVSSVHSFEIYGTWHCLPPPQRAKKVLGSVVLVPYWSHIQLLLKEEIYILSLFSNKTNTGSKTLKRLNF